MDPPIIDSRDLPAIDDTINEAGSADSTLSIEQLGMLVRSATTFLSITEQQLSRPSVDSSSDENTRTHRMADRLATLFVCKEKAAVAAVTFSRRAEDSVVFSLSQTSSYDDSSKENVGDELPKIEQVFLVKNSKGRTEDSQGDKKIKPPFKARPSAGKAYGENWIPSFLKSGPMLPAQHAKQLEALCQSYATAGDQSKQKAVMHQLKRFTYMQCQPKILQRFDTPLHPFTKRCFYEVFRPGTIPYSALVENFKTIDKSSLNLKSKFLKRNESALQKVAHHIGYDFNLDSDGHIILDSNSTIHYHKFVWYLLDAYHRNLAALSALRKPDKHNHDKRINSANTALTMIDKVANPLNDLAFRSPSFQIHLQHPEIKKWLVQAALQDEPRITPLSQNDKDILEDEGVLHSKELVTKEPVACFLNWLRLSVQWTEGVYTLSKALAKPVQFWALEQPPTSQGNKQATLNELFSQVLRTYPPRVKSAISRIQTTAAMESRREDSENATAWLSLTAEKWDLWGSNFSGRHHCESVIASIRYCKYEQVAMRIPEDRQKGFKALVEEMQKCSEVIGVSKACCHMCELYLNKKSHRELKIRGSSGKIFPWAIPPLEVNRAIYQSLWEAVEYQVWKSLVRLGAFATERHQSSPDSGEDDGEDYSDDWA